MTLSVSERLVPQWRVVDCAYLGKRIQVRRLTVGDVGIPIADLWTRIVRDEDGSPLLPPGVSGKEVDPDLVEEVCRLAAEDPCKAGASPASSARAS